MTLTEGLSSFKEAMGPMRALTLGFSDSLKGLSQAAGLVTRGMAAMASAIPIRLLEDFNRRVFELQRFTSVGYKEITNLHQAFNQTEGSVARSLRSFIELRKAIESTTLGFQPLRREITEALGKAFPYATDRAVSSLARLNDQNVILASSVAEGRLSINQYAVVLRNYGVEVANVAKRLSDQRAGVVSSTEGLRGYQVELLRSRQILDDFGVRAAKAFEAPATGALKMFNALSGSKVAQTLGGGMMDVVGQMAIPAMLGFGARGIMKRAGAMGPTIMGPAEAKALAPVIGQARANLEPSRIAMQQAQAMQAFQQKQMQPLIAPIMSAAPSKFSKFSNIGQVAQAAQRGMLPGTLTQMQGQQAIEINRQLRKFSSAVARAEMAYNNNARIVNNQSQLVSQAGGHIMGVRIPRRGVGMDINLRRMGTAGAGALMYGGALASIGSGSYEAGLQARGGEGGGMASSVLSGAGVGAMMGMAAGPVGAVIGGAIGGLISVVSNLIGQSNAKLAEIAENTAKGYQGIETLSDFYAGRSIDLNQIANVREQLNTLREERSGAASRLVGFGENIGEHSFAAGLFRQARGVQIGEARKIDQALADMEETIQGEEDLRYLRTDAVRIARRSGSQDEFTRTMRDQFDLGKFGSENEVSNYLENIYKGAQIQQQITPAGIEFTRGIAGPIRSVRQSESALLEAGVEKHDLQKWKKNFQMALDTRPGERLDEIRGEMQDIAGDNQALFNSLESDYKKLFGTLKELGAEGVLDLTSAQQMEDFAEASQDVLDNLEETQRAEQQLVRLMQQRLQAAQTLSQVYETQLRFQRQFYGADIGVAREAGTGATAAAETRFTQSLETYNELLKSSKMGNATVEGLGAGRGPGEVLNDLIRGLEQYGGLQERIAQDNALGQQLRALMSEFEALARLRFEAFDVPNQIAIEQMGVQRSILQSQLSMLEAMNRPLGERMSILGDQFKLEQALLVVQAKRLHDAEASGNLTISQLNQIKKEYADQARVVAEMSRTIRREWEEQFSAITLGLQTGQYTLMRELSDYESLGPAFVPYQRNRGTPAGTVELLEAERLGQGFRTAGERQRAIEATRGQGERATRFLGSAGFVPGEVREAQRMGLDIRLDASPEAQRILDATEIVLRARTRDPGE